MIRIVVSLVALAFVATPAFAHKMLVKVAVTELALQVTAEYEGGEAVPAGAKVALLDEHHEEVAEGIMDETGECRLSRPAPGIYTVTVDDRQGHLGELVFVVRDGATGTAESPRRNRWLMAAAGLAVIAAAGFAWGRLRRSTAISPT